MNPPGPLLPDLIAAMGTVPRLHLAAAGAERVADGLYRIWADVANDGFLPTSGSEAHKVPGRGRPIAAHLALAAGARLVPTSGEAEQTLGHLAGRVSQYSSFHFGGNYPNLARGHAEWLVAAPPDTALAITIKSEKAGTLRAMVTTGG